MSYGGERGEVVLRRKCESLHVGLLAADATTAATTAVGEAVGEPVSKAFGKAVAKASTKETEAVSTKNGL